MRGRGTTRVRRVGVPSSTTRVRGVSSCVVRGPFGTRRRTATHRWRTPPIRQSSRWRPRHGVTGRGAITAPGAHIQSQTGRPRMDAVAAVFALQVAPGGDWRRPLWSACAQSWSWGLVAPLHRRGKTAACRVPRRTSDAACWRTCTLSLAITALCVCGRGSTRPWASAPRRQSSLRADASGMFLSSWLVYWLADHVGAWLARQYGRVSSPATACERIERSSSDARLHALSATARFPHFL